MAKEHKDSGTLLRRPDGALYFIPDAVLERYRLSPAEAVQVQEVLAQDDDVQGYALVLPSLVEAVSTLVFRAPVAMLTTEAPRAA